MRPRQEGARKAAEDKIYASATGPLIKYEKNTIPLARPQNMKNDTPSAFFLFFLRKIAFRTHERNTACQNRKKIVYGEYFKGSCLTHLRCICLVFMNVFVIIVVRACLTFL